MHIVKINKYIAYMIEKALKCLKVQLGLYNVRFSMMMKYGFIEMDPFYFTAFVASSKLNNLSQKCIQLQCCLKICTFTFLYLKRKISSAELLVFYFPLKRPNIHAQDNTGGGGGGGGEVNPPPFHPPPPPCKYISLYPLAILQCYFIKGHYIVFSLSVLPQAWHDRRLIHNARGSPSVAYLISEGERQ